MIEMIRDSMLYERYIVFEDHGRKILLIDTKMSFEHEHGGLYLWEMDSMYNPKYDIDEDHRLKIIGVDVV